VFDCRVGSSGGNQMQSGVIGEFRSRLEIRRSTISCCSGPGIRASHSHVDVSQCILHHNGGGGNIVLRKCAGHIWSNRIRASTGDGVALWDSKSVMLWQNTVSDNRGHGIGVHQGRVPTTAHTNQFHNNRGGDVFDYGCGPPSNPP
jgi:hypothetical protein